jgi:hypothetical protein
MKTAWILAALALACCSPPPVADAPPATPDPASAALSAARPAAATAAERAGTHCVDGEAVVFSCAIEGKIVSVCVGPTTVDYRFGPLGAPELQIASTGADGAAHVSDLSSAGGRQSAVRFSSGGYEYVVHAMEAGQHTDVPGQTFAGVTVLQGDATVSDSDCPDPALHQFSTTDIPAEPEPDDRYEAWW